MFDELFLTTIASTVVDDIIDNKFKKAFKDITDKISACDNRIAELEQKNSSLCEGLVRAEQ